MNKVEKIKEKPKFKVGDSIHNKQWPTACHTIESIDSESYYLDNGGKVEIAHQDLWELKEEPVNSNLEEAAHSYVDTTIEHFDSEGSPCCYPAFIAGAQWQKKHLEMNRIKHCNNITEDQYNLETEFLDGWIEKYDRLPTFLDAIEYGMKLQKEQDQSTIELAEDHAMLAGMEKMKQEMMKDAVDGEIYFSMDMLQYRIITEPLGNFHHGDKVKLIIIKEE